MTREAAMAVGETSGQGAEPRRLVAAGGGRRRSRTRCTGQCGRTATVPTEAPEVPEGMVDQDTADMVATPRRPPTSSSASSARTRRSSAGPASTTRHPHFRKEVD